MPGYSNAVILGAMIAAFGGAAFAGTIVFGAIGHKLPRRLTLTLDYTLGGGSRFFWIVLLAPAIGIEPSMLFFGVVYSLATLSLLINPALRELDGRRGSLY